MQKNHIKHFFQSERKSFKENDITKLLKKIAVNKLATF